MLLESIKEHQNSPFERPDGLGYREPYLLGYITAAKYNGGETERQRV